MNKQSIHTARQNVAYRNLLRLRPVRVEQPIAEVLAKGRERSIQNAKVENIIRENFNNH